MAVDVQKGKTKVVRLVPDGPMGSPAATLYDRNDAVKATGLVCVPSAIDTEAVQDASNTRTVVRVNDPSGAAIGETVRFNLGNGRYATSVVSALNGAYLSLTDPLPEIPSDGAPVVGLDVLVTIPVEATDTLYLGYTLELSDGAGESIQEVVNVVRFVFAGPCTARDVRSLIARSYAGEGISDETLHKRIADEVNRQIRGRLLAGGDFASSYWDPDALALVKAPMLRLVLAEQYGMREAGSTRDDYLSSLRLEVRDRIGDILRSAQGNDHDNDGKILDEDKKRAFVIDMVL